MQGNSYDLVLMDKEMPVMDGHEVSEHSQTQNFLLHILCEMLWKLLVMGVIFDKKLFLTIAGYKTVTIDGSEDTYYSSHWKCIAI